MKKVFVILLITLLGGCKHLQTHIHTAETAAICIDSNEPALSFKNGFWYFGSNLFTGTIIERFASKTIHQSTQYKNGKEHGWQITYYAGGKLSEKRFYTKGEKDSVHTGWWQNGNRRFEYHFTNGIYSGDYKEWYETGEPLKHIHYTNGVDDWGKGWRQNGKLYMNFVMRDGRRYGLNNSNLCYTVRNGNGEYIASVAADK